MSRISSVSSVHSMANVRELNIDTLTVTIDTDGMPSAVSWMSLARRDPTRQAFEQAFMERPISRRQFLLAKAWLENNCPVTIQGRSAECNRSAAIVEICCELGDDGLIAM